jgi:sortase (surface protein transpeptidase)
MFFWAASLALAIVTTSVVVVQHSHAAEKSGTGVIIKAPSSTADLGGGPVRSTSPGLVATSPVVKLASLSSETSTGLNTPSSSKESRASLYAKRSTPIHLTIPVIGVSAPMVILGLNANGSPQVPSSWYIPGWYKYDASPGQYGTAVILGHIDSVAGPAVFYRINQLKYGDRVIVKLRDGVTVRFAVIAVREYLKAKFPDKYVYEAHGYAALQLVTCGGAFDYQTHHYLSNIVVFTKMVKR